MSWKVGKGHKIKNVKDGENIKNFYDGDMLPKDYNPPQSYIDQKIVIRNSRKTVDLKKTIVDKGDN